MQMLDLAPRVLTTLRTLGGRATVNQIKAAMPGYHRAPIQRALHWLQEHGRASITGTEADAIGPGSKPSVWSTDAPPPLTTLPAQGPQVQCSNCGRIRAGPRLADHEALPVSVHTGMTLIDCLDCARAALSHDVARAHRMHAQAWTPTRGEAP